MRFPGSRFRPASGTRSRRGAARVAGWLALFLLAGCHTPPKLLPPVRVDGPGWVLRQGQARWLPQRAGMVIAGEILYAAHPDGSFVIEFGKPPIPLVSAQFQAGRWQVVYPTFKKQADGRGALPAKHLWLLLPAALRGEPLPKGIVFDRLPEQRWHLENPRTGEYIEGFLLPPS
jgi:hypothetical protein